MKREGMLSVLRYTILAAVLLFGVWYVVTHYHRFAAEAAFTPGNISALCLLNLLTIICESIRLRLIVKKIGYDLGFTGAWRLFSVMQALNHVIVKAGTFSGGYYLSKKYGISFHRYIAFVVTFVVILVLAAGSFGLAVSMGYHFFHAGVNMMLPMFFLVLIFIPVLFIVLAGRGAPSFRLPKFIVKFLSAWKDIYTDYRLLFIMVSVEIGYFFLTALRFMIAITLFSEQVTFLDSVVVVTIGNFLRIASILPGGLGIAEAASGLTAGLLGVDTGLAVVAAGLDRFVYVALVMILGGIGFFTMSGRSDFHAPPEEKHLGE